jgi:hypothetical protein
MIMNKHQLWLDTLNMAQQQGKPLAEALEVADKCWPFPTWPNPLDTGHNRPKFNPANHEEAPL